MRFVTAPCVSVTLLLTLVYCAPAQAPKSRAVLEERTEYLSAIALSHDGKTLVTASLGLDRERGWKRWGEFRVWDVKTGKVVASFQGHDDKGERDYAAALSPDAPPQATRIDGHASHGSSE